MMSNRTLVAAAFFTMLLCTAGAAWWFTPPAVVTVKPERRPTVQAVYATGSVEAALSVPVAPRVAARLMSLRADEGQAVHKGAVLGQLEDTDFQLATKQLLAQERLARLEYDRSVKLAKSGFVSKAALDQARSALDAAQAATRRATAQAGFLQLIAPDDCLVVRRDGEIGTTIAANQPVFWLSCQSRLRVTAEVDEEDVARVVRGQLVLVRADAFPERTFKGKVESITPQGDAVARSFRVRVELTEATPLMIGMTAETNIIIHENPNAMVLPATALQGDSVWVIENGRLAERHVAIGVKDAERVEILSGVSATDDVVVDPDPALRRGQRVRIAMASPQ